MNDTAHILVVDDNHENLRVVSNFLKTKDYKIALAIDGDSALEVIRNNPIDLVLLDVMMPGKDGFEVCREIKLDDYLAEIPIIFLTAKNASEDIVKGFNAGGVDYLTKPFLRDELLMRVETHIEHSKTKKKIIDTIKTRDKLYSIIAHDIRAPFSAISMLVSMLNDDDSLPQKQDFSVDVVQLLKKTVDETIVLLDNLLEWTKLQTDRISIDPQYIEVSTLVTGCINLLKENANAKNISLKSEIEMGLTAFFDEITIHTVLRNLISNAIKFTPDQGSVILSAKEDGNYLSIKVKDTGQGMTEEIIKKIRGDAVMYSTYGTKQEKGSGLGLKIVKDLIAQNRGIFFIESEVGIGTQVTIKVPLTND